MNWGNVLAGIGGQKAEDQMCADIGGGLGAAVTFPFITTPMAR